MKEQEEFNGKWPTDGLPGYTPPASVWERIEAELALQEAIAKLPVHEPPAEAWSTLEAALDGKNASNRAWWSTSVIRWAAAITLLIGSAVVYKSLQQVKDTKLVYRVEWAPAEEFPFGNEGTPQAGTLIQQLCARAIHICESSDFKELEEELYQLETARDEVQARMNPYGDNDELERMLMQIELQHAEIVKRMTNTLL